MEKHVMDINGNYIQSQFCSYEIALKLNKLGFNEECLGYFRNNTKSFHLGEDTRVQKDSVLAPLWQQAFDYFRERYGVFIQIRFADKALTQYTFFVYSDFNELVNDIIKGIKSGNDYKVYSNYHEAYEQAILETIEYIRQKIHSGLCKNHKGL